MAAGVGDLLPDPSLRVQRSSPRSSSSPRAGIAVTGAIVRVTSLRLAARLGRSAFGQLHPGGGRRGPAGPPGVEFGNRMVSVAVVIAAAWRCWPSPEPGDGRGAGLCVVDARLDGRAGVIGGITVRTGLRGGRLSIHLLAS